MQSTQHVDETRQRVVYITQDDCVRTLSSNCSTREMKSEKFPFCTSTCQQRQMIHCFTSLVVHIHNIILQLFFHLTNKAEYICTSFKSSWKCVLPVFTPTQPFCSRPKHNRRTHWQNVSRL